MSNIAKDFISYVRSLSPAIFRLPILGNFDAYDDYDRSTSYVGSPYINQVENGYGFRNGVVSIASGPEQVSSNDEGCFFILSNLFKDVVDELGTDNERICVKRDAGNNEVDIRLRVQSGVQYLYVNDSSYARYIIHSFHGSKSIGINYADGEAFECFNDGKFIGVGSGVSDITSQALPVHFGGYYTGTLLLKSYLQAIIYFNRKLSKQEHSNLHLLASKLHVNTTKPRLSRPKRIIIPDNVLSLNGRTPHGLVQDVSGSDVHFTPTSETIFEGEGPSGNRPYAATGGVRDSSYIEATNTKIDNISPSTYSFLVRVDGAHEGGTGSIYSKNTWAVRIYCVGTNFYVAQQWSGSNAVWYVSSMLPVSSVFKHCVVCFSDVEGEVPKIWLNGVQQTVVTSVASSGSKLSDVGTARILDHGGGGREFNGAIDDFQIYDRCLTDEEIQSLYIKIASRCLDSGYLKRYPDSLGNISSGMIHRYSIDTGIWSVENNVITNHGSGGAHYPSGHVYGALYFKIYKDLRTTFFLNMTHALLPKLYSASGQYGYLFDITNTNSLAIYRITNGVIANFGIVTSADAINAGINYEFFVLRTPDERWDVWVRGGAYTSWTLLDSATDPSPNIYTGYRTLYMYPDNSYSKELFFPYFYEGTPDDIPLLAA